MPVSFYALVAIIISSSLLTLLPFAGFPYAWSRALTAIFGALTFGVSIYSLYRGYTRAIARLEKRDERERARAQIERNMREAQEATESHSEDEASEQE